MARLIAVETLVALLIALHLLKSISRESLALNSFAAFDYAPATASSI